MPKILHDRVRKIKAGNPNMPESEAWAIAAKQLRKMGGIPKSKKRKKSR